MGHTLHPGTPLGNPAATKAVLPRLAVRTLAQLLCGMPARVHETKGYPSIPTAGTLAPEDARTGAHPSMWSTQGSSCGLKRN